MEEQARRQRGYNITELMIVTALIAIITAIAIPNYSDYVLRTKRSVARNALVDISARQEGHYVSARTYTNDMALLGYATPTQIDDQGQLVAEGSSNALYTLSVTAADASGFTLQAQAINHQTKDSGCAVFTLNSAGVRTPEACW